MRTWALVVLAACGGSNAPVGTPHGDLHGVYVEDLDRAADPCTDFFAFANGAWRKANPIPASQPKWSRRWESGEKAKTALKDILEEVSAKRDWQAHSTEQLIGDFYGGCMDEATIEKTGSEPLKAMLAQIDGVKTKADVVAVITRLAHERIYAPVFFASTVDVHDPEHVIADVGAAGLGMPDRDYYVKTEPRFADAREKYVAHVGKMLELAGRDPKSAATIMAFETRLAQASMTNEEQRDPKNLDHPMSVAQLQALTPSFDWTAFEKDLHVPAIGLTVDQPAFMAAFEKELATTPIADWKIYLAWKYIDARATDLGKAFFDEQFAFGGKYLAGTPEPKPRWKRCVEDADNLLGDAVGKKYVEKYFPPAAKARMNELVDNLLSAMHDDLETVSWMSAPTKQKAFEKLSTFHKKIGYPDKWKDYSAVTIARDQHFAAMTAMNVWNNDDDLALIGKPTDHARWGMTAATSDASYNPTTNEITFPAGILQPPAFRMDAVDAINYGAIGVVIGHEISHGFDDQGAQFDAKGRLENWWQPADLTAFQERGACISQQFEAYEIEPGVHHNGKLILGESIGDAGGASIAYRAFEKAKAAHGAPTLDGFTPEQQFFIAWGQFRGDETRIEQQRLMVQGDPHPVAKFRVIGPLSNMAEFATAFSCKAGQAMVREHPCKVW
ncbi:MAG: M13 family metallopeptidase [Kofleriaceae bacterium]